MAVWVAYAAVAVALYEMSAASRAQASNAFNQPQALGVDLDTSNYGAPVAVVYGQNKVGANCIWYGDFTTTQVTGGKGGGGPTSYNYSASYMFAVCEGPITSFGNVWQGSSFEALSNLNPAFEALGNLGQAAWSHFGGTQALGYSKTVLLAFLNQNLGGSATTPNYQFEVNGFDQFGGGVTDALPSAIANDICTDAYHGIGFPYLGSLTAWQNYCQANGLFISPVYSTESTAAAVLADLLKWTNSAAYFSEGVLKIVPYGDIAVTGNGATYTPVLTPVAAFTDANILYDDGQPPVTMQRKALVDTSNTVRVQYSDRAYYYYDEMVEARDQFDSITNGVRAMTSLRADAVTLPSVARFIAQNILQRDLYIRNTYQWRAPWQYAFLEPMDPVTITDVNLGLGTTLVRITKVEEKEDGSLDIEAEELPIGVGHSAAYNTQANGGATNNILQDPGPIETPFIFRGPSFMVTPNTAEIWVALAGSTPQWGSCQVYLSFDNVNFFFKAGWGLQARYGLLNLASWQASTVMAVGQLIQDPVTHTTQQVSVITSDDKTGASVPSFNATLGGTTTDNHVTWTNVGVPVAAPTSGPTYAPVSGGSLPARSEFYKITWNTPTGETTPSPETSASPASGHLATITKGANVPPAAATSFNVYGSSTTGTEVLQATGIALTGIWTEPVTGLVTGTASPPSVNNTGLIALPVSTDPDTTNIPLVDLNFGTLTGGTQAEADALQMASMVGAEIISYENATLVATEQYDLSYLRRGAYGTTAVNHIPGETFCRLDDNILRIGIDPSYVGQTVYIKFLSYNQFGMTPRTLASETSYPYVVGSNSYLPDVPPQVTGLTATASADLITLKWTNPFPASVGSTSVELAPVWVPNNPVALNTLQLDPNGNVWKCTTNGITGALPQPTWPSSSLVVGTTTQVDGTVTWTLASIGAPAIGLANCPFSVFGTTSGTSNVFRHEFIGDQAYYYRIIQRGWVVTAGWGVYSAIVTTNGAGIVRHNAKLGSANMLLDPNFDRTLFSTDMTFWTFNPSLYTIAMTGGVDGTACGASTSVPGTSTDIFTANEYLPTRVGDSVYFRSMMLRSGAGSTGNFTMGIEYFDATYTSINNNGEVSIPLSALSTSGWSIYGTYFLTPSGAHYFRVYMRTGVTANQNVKFDKLYVSIQDWAYGSIPPCVCNTTLSYTSTTTSITVSWTGFNVQLPDTTSISVVNGSIATTGLSAGTTYFTYLYYALYFGAGSTEGVAGALWAGHGHGSPSAIMFTQVSPTPAQNQQNLNNFPLSSGAFQVATPASGTGSGSGGGSSGGTGGCMHAKDMIRVRLEEFAAEETFMQAELLRDGIEVLTPDGWRAIANLKMQDESDLVRITTDDGQRLCRTGEHILYDVAGAEIRVRDIRLGQLLQTETGRTRVKRLELTDGIQRKVSFDVEGHIFYAQEAGVREHNMNFKP